MKLKKLSATCFTKLKYQWYMPFILSRHKYLAGQADFQLSTSQNEVSNFQACLKTPITRHNGHSGKDSENNSGMFNRIRLLRKAAAEFHFYDCIQAGLPRTATTSIKAALEGLGYGPCYHLIDVPTWIDCTKSSAKILQTSDKHQRQRMLKDLFEPYGSILDLPGSACLDDLLEIYPNAKVGRHIPLIQTHIFIPILTY